MIKLSEKNRSYIFLGGIVVVGIIFIGALMLFENEDVGRYEKVDDPPPTNSLSLESKIAQLSDQNFTPSIYSTLSTEIETSHSQDLITREVKENLISSLKTKYSNLVYNKCNFFLTGNSTNSSNEVFGLLKQVEGIIGADKRIDRYREQIRLYEYYTKVLPSKVQRFLQGGTLEFQERVYLQYKKELENMPGLDGKYRNTPKLSQIKTNFVAKLEKLYNEYSKPVDDLEE